MVCHPPLFSKWTKTSAAEGCVASPEDNDNGDECEDVDDHERVLHGREQGSAIDVEDIDEDEVGTKANMKRY